MKVDVGKSHNERDDCLLCNFTAKDLVYMSTFQIYMCDDCYYTIIHIDEIKEHLENVHRSPYDKLIIFAGFSGSGDEKD